MRDVCIIAVGMIPFGKYPSEGIKDLTAKALKNTARLLRAKSKPRG